MPSGGRTWWTQEHRDRQMCPLWPDCCITEERVELGASTNQLHQACTASSANTVACMNSNWSPTFKQMADEWCTWRIKSGSLIALRMKSNLILGVECRCHIQNCDMELWRTINALNLWRAAEADRVVYNFIRGHCRIQQLLRQRRSCV